MRVLHCIPGMGGGGAERQLAYLSGPLGRLGWEVHVALMAGGPNLHRLERSGAVIHPLPAQGNHDPRLLWHIARLICKVKPALMQVWFVQMTVLAGAAAEVLRVPWIISERSSVLAYPPSFKNRLRVALAFTADGIVSNSLGGDEYWRERLDGRVPRFVIPNALPLDEIAAANSALPAGCQIAPDADVVLFAGRFEREKNIGVLLDAIRMLPNQRHLVAVLCGDGPLRPDIARRIVNEGFGDRVLLPGYVPQIWALMKRAQVVVSVALFEGRPNSVLEAMAAGRPLVVSDIPAHREFLDQDTAMFVRADRAPEIAEAIRHVLENPGAAAQRAAAAQARATAWSVLAAAAEYDHAYRAVLANRPGRVP